MPQAINGLSNDLSKYCPTLELLGTANGVVSGAKLVKQLKPDIVFLDIMMGDGTGFDFLEIVGDLDFKVIFTTASDEHALRAFRYAAVDYLLKPIDPEDLQDAVSRAINQIHTNNSQIPILKEAYASSSPEKIALHTQEKVHIVDVSDITRCASDNNCTWFYFKEEKKLLVTKTLKGFEQLLKDQGFLRCHQSHLVNGNFIKEFIKVDGGYLIMHNGDRIPVSTRRKPHVMKWLVNLRR